MVCVTLEGFWMVSYRIVIFRDFVKFQKSGPATISTVEHSLKRPNLTDLREELRHLLQGTSGWALNTFFFAISSRPLFGSIATTLPSGPT